VLVPGGRLFATWYLLSDEQAAGPPPPFGVHDSTRPAATADPAEPESAVAFPESWLGQRLADRGLALRQIHAGSWSGRPGRSRQDIVVATRG
jgi:hypothetical protein